MKPRLGVFGGTFDPPHLGHLALAEWAREQLGLSRVLFVPAGQPPHKRGRRVTPARHRLAMTRLAVRGHPAFAVSAIEARRRGPSFTVETLRALRRRFPRAELWLLVGADSLNELHTWRAPQEIVALSRLAVAARPGARRAPASAGRRPPRAVRLENPGIAVSSSALRSRSAAGASLRYLVPDAVAAYIRRHRLYRSGA
jgi:nicotinate-nucleotide adenylyltransferase